MNTETDTNDDTKSVAVVSPAPMRWIFGGERPEGLDDIDYVALREENLMHEEMFSCGKPKPDGIKLVLEQWDKNWSDDIK
jgi:hypothetical protein